MPTTERTSLRPLISRRWIVGVIAARLQAATGRVVCLATAQPPAASDRWYVVESITLTRRHRGLHSEDPDTGVAQVSVLCVCADTVPGAYELEDLAIDAVRALDGYAARRVEAPGGPAPAPDESQLIVTGVDEMAPPESDIDRKIREVRLVVTCQVDRAAGR